MPLNLTSLSFFLILVAILSAPKDEPVYLMPVSFSELRYLRHKSLKVSVILPDHLRHRRFVQRFLKYSNSVYFAKVSKPLIAFRQ